MKIASLIIIAALVSGCATTGDDVNYYVQPQSNAPKVVFWGEESEDEFFVKGHETIYVCGIDGAFQDSTSFDKPTYIAFGERVVTICYLEGGNDAKAQIRTTFDKERNYQIKLGQHSWTKVNFSVIDKDSGELVFGPVTVPKQAGDLPVLIF